MDYISILHKIFHFKSWVQSLGKFKLRNKVNFNKIQVFVSWIIFAIS